MALTIGTVVKMIGQDVKMTVENTISKRSLTSENAPEYIKAQVDGLKQMFGESGDPQYMVLCSWFNDAKMLMRNWISSSILTEVTD